MMTSGVKMGSPSGNLIISGYKVDSDYLSQVSSGLIKVDSEQIVSTANYNNVDVLLRKRA